MTPTHSRRAWLATLLSSLAMLAPLAHAATVGSGRPATESRNLPAFEAVAVAGGIDLELRQGATATVEVSADDNLLPLLETRVEPGRDGATLKISFKRGESVTTRATPRVRIVMPTLKSVSSAGAGDVDIEAFDTPALKIAVAGSGEVKLARLTTAELAVSISGSGGVEGSGKAAKLAVSIAGSGEVDLDDLVADNATVKIVGSGEAGLHANRTLEVTIAGSGDVSYRGDAKVTQKVMGSGIVQRK